MRVDGILGIYLQYKDVAAPVENLDRQVYAFPKSCDRTCLVSNPDHIEFLLNTGKYRIVGVEIADRLEKTAKPADGDHSVVPEPSTVSPVEVQPKPKKKPADHER